jgi:hypothetical protein
MILSDEMLRTLAWLCREHQRVGKLNITLEAKDVRALCLEVLALRTVEQGMRQKLGLDEEVDTC